MLQLSGSVQSLVSRNHKIEQTIGVLQSSADSASVHLSEIQEKVKLLNHTSERAIAVQGSALQNLKDGFIKNELTKFQRLLARGNNDRTSVLKKLKRLNDRIEQLGVNDHRLATTNSRDDDVQSTDGGPIADILRWSPEKLSG
jgi:uncharacterized protein HemX